MFRWLTGLRRAYKVQDALAARLAKAERERDEALAVVRSYRQQLELVSLSEAMQTPIRFAAAIYLRGPGSGATLVSVAAQRPCDSENSQVRITRKENGGRMKTATHTPGPWTVIEKTNGTLGICAKELDGTDCRPEQINGDPADGEYGPSTWANARLIAAAPDLLAACQAILTGESVSGMTPEDAARAAIAKATGTG